MELKLAQELSSKDHKPLFLVFLHLRKAYNIFYRERLILTLEGYGARPCLCGLSDTSWAHQQVVPRQSVFCGMALPAT